MKGDALDEPIEGLTLELRGPFEEPVPSSDPNAPAPPPPTPAANPTGATFLGGGSKLTATGTINDNDAAPTLSIGDVSVLEGGNAVFTVTLAGGHERSVSVRYMLTDGTATAGSDFSAGTPQTLIFAPGETTKTITIPTLNDDRFEPSENFTVRLVNPSNAALGDSTATGTILDNDTAVLTVSDVQVNEGAAGEQTRMIFTVRRSGFLDQTVSVNYAALAGTATNTGANPDFALADPDADSLVFQPGETEKTVEVIVFGDNVKELANVNGSYVNETLTLQLFNPQNAILASPNGTTTDPLRGTVISGLGTILNDDTQVALRIVNTGAIVAESDSGTRSATFRVELSAPFTDAAGEAKDVSFTMGTVENGSDPSGSRRAQASTLDDPTTAANELVTRDYDPIASQTLTIAKNTISQDFVVTVNGDNVFETTEFFTVKILSVATDGVIGKDTTSTGVIANDDVRLVNSRTLQWGDENGDIVTMKISKGAFDPNGNDFVFGASGLGKTLQALVLSDDGQEFRHANITVTAEQDRLPNDADNISLGDGRVNVGYIKAGSGDVLATTGGVDLGTIKIQGDLGRIDAGDNFSDVAVRRIDVLSMGAVAGTLPTGFTSASTIIGPLVGLKVAGDMKGFLQVVGKQFGNIGRVDIGALVGGSTDSSGTITFTGTLAHAVIGEITGGTGANSGSIQGASDTVTAIGSVKVLGGLTAGTGDDSGVIRAKSIGSVDVGFLNGHVATGTSGQRSAAVIADRSLGSVVVHGSITGGTTTATGDLAISGGIFSFGNIGKVRVEGDVVGGGTAQSSTGTDTSGMDAGAIRASGSIRSVAVEGALIGGSGTYSGSIRAGGNLGTATVGAMLGGAGVSSGAVDVSGSLVLKVDGSVTGGDGVRSGSIRGGTIKNLVVEDQLIGGSQTNSGSVLAGNLVRAEFGHRATPGSQADPDDVFTIMGGAGAVSGSVSANGNLGKLLVHGSVIGGQGTGSGGLGASGRVSSITLEGSLYGGFVATVDNPNSGIRTGFIDAGSIGSIVIAGSVHSGNVLNSGSINATGAIGSVSIGKDFLNTGGADALILAGGTTSGLAIGHVEIGGRVSGAQILAGQSFLGQNFRFSADAQIGTVEIGGNVSSLSIIAGASKGLDGVFGTSDDTVLAGGSVLDNAKVLSRIASVIIRGSVVATDAQNNPVAASGIVAQELVSIRVGSGLVKVPLAAGPSNDLAPVPVGGVAQFGARELPLAAAATA